MAQKMSVCSELLALVDERSGAEAMISCLELLGRKCAAVEAAIELDDFHGSIQYPFTWAEGSLAGADRHFAPSKDSDQFAGDCAASRTEVFELRSTAETRMVLVVRLQHKEIPDEVRSECEQIRTVFCLVFDRTQLQQELDATTQRLGNLAEFGTDWFWETDAAERFTYVSKDIITLGLDPNMFLAHTRDEIGSYAGADIMAPDWIAVQSCIAARAPFCKFHHPVLLDNGTRLWLSSSGKPNFGKSGIFLGYKGVCSKLTEVIKEESSARDLVERLTAILNALPDLIFEITQDGQYTDFIAGPPELIVGAQEHLPGKTFEEILPADVAALSRNALELTLSDGKCPAVRYKLNTHAGWHWFETSGARKPPMREGGEPTAIFVIRDVTEEVRQQEEISRLFKILETMTNLVAIVDQEKRIIWVNNAWESRTGWTLDEVQGQDLAALVRCPDVGLENAIRVDEALQKSLPFHGETVNTDRHGNRYWVDFNILPLFQNDGSVEGYVSVETDITDQKESINQMQMMAAGEQKMRNHLKNAIEALPDGVVIWDNEERLVAVNSAYGAMYPEISEMLVEGVSQDKILRVGVQRRAFPDAWGREEEWIKEQYARYKKPSIDTILRPDGRSIRRLDLRTSDGGRVAVRIDTTTAQQQLISLASMNRALDEAQRSLSRIIKSADVGTWEWDVETNGLQIGGSYAEMLGYTAKELGPPSNDMFRSLVHPEDLSLLDSTEDTDFHQTPNGAEPVLEHEFRMRHKDASWQWIHSRSAVSERLPDGRHKVVVGIHLNVTVRKRLEDELRSNEFFMLQVMDGSISAIAVLDENGTITYANAEAERVLGMGRSAIKGRAYDAPVWGVTAPDGQQMEGADHPFRQALDKNGPVRDIRMAIEWPNGKRQTLSVNAVPYRDANGKTQVIMSFFNITDEILKTELLELALTDARAASRSKSSFLANMSHEIRTPLNGVLGMAEILDGLITEPREKEMIRTIRASGEMLLTVLNEILDMSKIEAGKMELETVPFVPTEIVSNIEPLHRLRAEEKGIEFEVLTSKGADLVWLGDQFRIQQILNNLLSNAIKFTETGSVSLSLSIREGKPLVIEVRDTGIGMTPEQVDRVFMSFEQAEGGTTRRFGGTGLGMAIVRKLIDLMGGEITIESVLGRGTIMRVSVPLTIAPAKSAFLQRETTSLSPETPQLAGIRLLVADDSAINLQVLQEMLSGTQAHLTFATNGAEAVEEWKRMRSIGKAADMLILDISMPVLDGVGALVTIRLIEGDGPQVPAIAVTANAMSHQVTEYIMAGFDAHVPKPFRQSVLFHAITTLLPNGANTTS